jgi:hypothetical protein
LQGFPRIILEEKRVKIRANIAAIIRVFPVLGKLEMRTLHFLFAVVNVLFENIDQRNLDSTLALGSHFKSGNIYIITQVVSRNGKFPDSIRMFIHIKPLMDKRIIDIRSTT